MENMTKKTFLNELEEELKGLPENEVKSIMEDYKDYFKHINSDSVALSKLDSPQDIADEKYRDFYGEFYDEKYKLLDKSKRKSRNIPFIFGVTFGFLAFPLVLLIIVILLGLGIVGLISTLTL